MLLKTNSFPLQFNISKVQFFQANTTVQQCSKKVNNFISQIIQKLTLPLGILEENQYMQKASLLFLPPNACKEYSQSVKA